MRLSGLAVAVAAATVLSFSSASASVITSLPGGTAQVMPTTNQFGPGPHTFGDVTWTNEGTGGVFGYTNGYGFNDNGSWYAPPMVGTDNGTGAMNFTFGITITAFLADVNWAVYQSAGFADAYMSAFDSSNNLLESIHFSSNNSNLLAPGYYGFERLGGDIARIEMKGAYIGARNISLNGTGGGGPVPEPASWTLMILGFGSVGAMLRSRRRAVLA